MHNELRIQLYGYTTEFLIGTILKDQMNKIFEFCDKHHKELKRVWYFPLEEDNQFMRDLFKIKHPWYWHRVANVSRQYGLTFLDKTMIEEFLRGEAARPKIQTVYLDNKAMDFDHAKISCHYDDPAQLPKLKAGEIFVYHGVVDRVEMEYIFKTDIPDFDESLLEFYFTESDEYGYMLSDITYRSEKASIRLKGSTGIQPLDLKFVDQYLIYTSFDQI